METRVADNPDYGRYEIHADGKLAGFTLYRDRGERRISLTHTEVFDEFEGRGVGSALVAGTLDDLRSREHRGAPVLPLRPRVHPAITPSTSTWCRSPSGRGSSSEPPVAPSRGALAQGPGL